MSYQIIRQPNGLYAVWSTVVDTFTMTDATPEEIVDEWTEEYRAEVARKVNHIAHQLSDHPGSRPYYQFTMTWSEALEKHRSVHGKEFDPTLAR